MNFRLQKTKLGTFLIVFLLTLFSASLFAENVFEANFPDSKVTLNVKNEYVKNVFAKITKQTGLTFIYEESALKDIKPVSLNVNEKLVKDVLDLISEQTDLKFIQTNNTIAVSKRGIIKPGSDKLQQKVEKKRRITGTVHSESGEALIGASIKVKGRSIGTVTDIDGKYNIEVDNNDILEISYIGFQAQNITIGNKNVVNINLKEDSQNLNEIVVVGYGTQKKVNLTGAVGNIQMDDLGDRPLTNSSNALQGTISGVYALQKSGKPGDDDAVINIRGVGTLNNSDPLVLIDGFPGSMNDVSASDIKSISVLKDASSAAIYGNRAANGVILITTKRGATGKMLITYNAYYGEQEATALPKMLSSVDWVTLYNEACVNSGSIPKYTNEEIQKYAARNDPMYPDINYFDVYYDKAKIQNHRFNITGGSENLQYAFMLGYLDQDGILVATNYRKTDFRSNIDAYFLKDKKLRFSTRISGNLGKKNQPTEEYYALRSGTIAPIWPLKNASDQWVAVIGEHNYYGEIMDGSTTKINRYTFNSQFEAEYQIINNLSAQVTYGYNVVSTNTNAFHANVLLANLDGSTRSLTSDLTETNNLDTQTLLTSLLKYKKEIGKHEINLLAGYSEENFNWKWNSGYRSSFINNDQRILNLGDPATMKNDAANYALGLQSVFGRVNYNYANKYLFEANIRRDGSSRFAKGLRWGTFPSFSAGWLMSEESFLKNIKWLNMLKLRGSWGRLGNQNINSYYAASDILVSSQNYSLGGNLNSGVAITSMSNKQTTWETTEQTNIGLDLRIKNAFEINFDYFNKKTSDILVQIPIPITLGNLTAPYQNVGEVVNKGFEFSGTYKKTFSNGLKFKGTLNLSHIINKTTDLYGRSPIINGKQVLAEGYAINSFYGYKTDGVYQISDFTWQNNSDPSITHADRQYTLKPGVVSVANFTATPGDLKYKDLSGDGVVTMDKDRTVIGKQFPDLAYSFQLNLDWKQFDLSLFFQGVQGIEGYTDWNIATATNIQDWWIKRWTPENPTNVIPKITLDAVRTGISSDFYMGNASYLRLKNIELGYTLNKTITSIAKINSIRVYGNIQNAFTITKFKGLDPEQVVGQVGVEAYPQVRVFTLGVNVNF